MRKTSPLKIFQVTYGLSNDQLAKKMGRTEQTILSYFKGTSYPTMKDLYNLVDFYPLDEVQDLAKNWLKWIHDNEKSE